MHYLHYPAAPYERGEAQQALDPACVLSPMYTPFMMNKKSQDALVRVLTFFVAD